LVTSSEPSRSRSPPSRRRRPSSPPPGSGAAPMVVPRLRDADPSRRRERERQMGLDLANAELSGQHDRPKVAVDLRAEMTKMAATRGGGAYIPPHRLRAIMQQAQDDKDTSTAEFQRLSWDALRKSINGLINKVNISNIKLIVPEVSTRQRTNIHRALLTVIFISAWIAAVWGEPHPWTWIVRAVNDAGPGQLAPVHSNLRFARRHRKHQIAPSGRTPPYSPDLPVPSLLQAQRQGNSTLAFSCPRLFDR